MTLKLMGGWKWMVGNGWLKMVGQLEIEVCNMEMDGWNVKLFPFWRQIGPIFRGEIAVSCRECASKEDLFTVRVYIYCSLPCLMLDSYIEKRNLSFKYRFFIGPTRVCFRGCTKQKVACNSQNKYGCFQE